MIKTQHIETLLAIERAGSIRAAAKALDRTQPAVTKALRQAEAELGITIFKRAPSGVAITEEGQLVLKRANVVHAELRRMEEEIAQRRGVGTGTINVTVSPLAATRLIAATIRLFRRRFPEVHVQISGGHEPMAFGPVRDGLVDAVIGPEPQEKESAGLSVEFLIETPISVITGKGSKWSGTTDLADLIQGDWLMIGTRSRLPYLQRHFSRQGLEPPVPMVTSDSIFSVLSMVQDSDFLCTFPELLIPEIARRWHIEALNLSTPLAPARIAITTASERRPTPAIQAFIDCTAQVARNAFR